MNGALPTYPFDAQRLIGTITEVGPATAKANLPKAAEVEGQWLYGRHLGAGEVGEFVIAECGDMGAFGRIVSVRLPERERLTVEPELGTTREAHPVGTIQLLTTIDIKSGKVSGGISQYPRLGARVYAAHPLVVKWVAEATRRHETRENPLVLDIAYLPGAQDTGVALTPERLFGRHCAILGTTGGGKSWTLARVIEQVARQNGKVILLDATGEFHTLDCNVRHVHLGSDPDAKGNSTEVVFPYQELTEGDLFALFKPSGQTQAPKLRAAMKSLKLALIMNREGTPLGIETDGVVVKEKRAKAQFEAAYTQHAALVEGVAADFDITKLSRQIQEECVWITDYNDDAKWGKYNENEKSYCVSLLTRIEDMLWSGELACVFSPGDKAILPDIIDEFMKNSNHRVLRISLKYLSFSHNAREIVANAIGRCLLSLGRDGRFRKKPVVVALDEAHQFLDKSLGDENTRYPLDSFELIAKEGRKFSLSICMSTQRPRDIPEGVLSQMGTLMVHRLVNDRDREVVERASGDIDRSAAAFLPTLTPGEAVIVGVDFAIPLTIKVWEPEHPPDSKGPDYQAHWRGLPVGQPDEAVTGEVQEPTADDEDEEDILF